jgi:putative transposase
LNDIPDTSRMPWKESDALSERVKFILEWHRRWEAARGGRVNVAELCRMYGVSRETAYVWIHRFKDSGCDLRAMEERSRRPHSNRRAVDESTEDLLVAARKARPKWGPVMLRAWLVERFPAICFPSPSSINNILKRRGLVSPRKLRRSRRGGVVIATPFPACNGPNDTWCMDFKGWFRLGNGEKCYPFTLIDAWSRFLVRCEGTLTPNGNDVERFLDSAFRDYGLPKTIRSDGGPPFFASQSPANLSRVAVWLLRLGITVECIAPAKPQQNGVLERFHRTLKLEVEPAETLVAQQRAFDIFRRRYNFERPHSTRALRPPATAYRRSSRQYPRSLLPPQQEGFETHFERIDRRGWLPWRRKRIFVGEAFSGEYVGVWPTDGTKWELFFGKICLGHFADGDRTLIPRRRPKGTMRLSLLGDDDPA